MSDFEQLMATLNAIDSEQPEEMAKALPAEAGDEKKNDNPSAKGKPETEAESDYEKKEEDEDEEGEEEGEMEKCSMTKSFTNADGEEVIDATEILESLQKSYAAHDDVLAKAMPKMVELLTAQSAQIKEQGALIKSLQDSVTALGARGTGRKSTVTVMAKSQVSTEAKEEQPQVTKETLMAKAMNLFSEQKLSSLQVNKLDVALRNGYAPDAEVLALLTK
ncbi:hypothetical protein D0Q53_20420 [Salmonella enterica]|nr:hypothetical protein [Salmonella enterica]EFF4796092.1 hypothetical protein [Escherichia coli]EBL0923895.1 hypothetical protein [Salmonella enterica]ECO7324685.1 hypothetical protein [Salmonella enterica]ECZ0806876.1 hypothetical protein [Salmonella enterica]